MVADKKAKPRRRRTRAEMKAAREAEARAKEAEKATEKPVEAAPEPSTPVPTPEHIQEPEKRPEGLTTDVLKKVTHAGPENADDPAAQFSNSMTVRTLTVDDLDIAPKPPKQSTLRPAQTHESIMGKPDMILRYNRDPRYTGRVSVPLTGANDPNTGLPHHYDIEFVDGRCKVPRKLYEMIQNEGLSKVFHEQP